MTLHRRDPYLWIHLAGLATVPLWLDVCLVGLAVEEPLVAPWLELVTLALVGTVPILWMQLQRPFYIFSVPGLALRPDKLAAQRRQLLTLQRGWLSRSLVLLGAMGLLLTLYWLYQLAPIATDPPWLTGKSRATGWGICAIAFLLANLFTLVPTTVIPLFLTSPTRLEKTAPVAADQILKQFTVLGLRLGKILPEVPQAVEPESSDELAATATDLTPSPSISAATAASTPIVADTAEADTTADAVDHADETVTTVPSITIDAAENESADHLLVRETEPVVAASETDLVAEPAADESVSPAPDFQPLDTSVPEAASVTAAQANGAANLSTDPASNPAEETVSPADTSVANQSAIAAHDADSATSPNTHTSEVESISSLDEVIIDDEDEPTAHPPTEEPSTEHSEMGSLNSAQSETR